MNFGVADPTYAAVGGAPLPGAGVWTAGFNVSSGGRYIKQGTLVIDIFDKQQRKLIWSAIASDSIHEKTDKAIQQIGKIVTSMFSHYPVKG
jgi:isoaspartyl peptidase/L-asparaginase-like protein (Ntn-hydrolase superfamily)